MKRMIKSKSSSGLLESLSDDQIYRSERRKSILPKECNKQIKRKNINDIKTTVGKPNFKRKIIEIEGDGKLGIIFTENDNLLCIKKILEKTVASEFYELQVGMVVIQINNIDCRGKSYFKSMECLGNLWQENSCVTLHLEYENPFDNINNPINNPIYKFLERIDCEDNYDDFTKLGATRLDDLKFIEYNDLIKMEIPILKRRKLQKILLGEYDNNIYKSKINIYFNPDLLEEEKNKELEKIKKIYSRDFEINVFTNQNNL